MSSLLAVRDGSSLFPTYGGGCFTATSSAAAYVVVEEDAACSGAIVDVENCDGGASWWSCVLALFSGCSSVMGTGPLALVVSIVLDVGGAIA